MKNRFDEKSNSYINLKQIEEDIVWNQESKMKLQNRILFNIDKSEQKTRLSNRFKYITSIGVIIVFMLFGYNILITNMSNSGEASPELGSNQAQDNLIIDELDDEENINNSREENEEKELPRVSRSQVTKQELMKEMDLRLPKYIPSEVNIVPKYIKHEHPDGHLLAEAKYMETKSHFLNYTQTQIEQSKEDSIKFVKEEMYKSKEIDEIEIGGYPSFFRLEGDTSYYSSLHIITDEYFITLTTHGFGKEEILKIANTIDLTGL